MLPPGHPDPQWMKEAIRVAKESRERGDYAFGVVLIREGKIVTASGNLADAAYMIRASGSYRRGRWRRVRKTGHAW